MAGRGHFRGGVKVVAKWPTYPGGVFLCGDAVYHPAMRADELMETGDMDGRAVWLRIVKAVEELLPKERFTFKSSHHEPPFTK